MSQEHKEDIDASVGQNRFAQGVRQIREGFRRIVSPEKNVVFDPMKEEEPENDPVSLLLDFFKRDCKENGFEKLPEGFEFSDVIRWAQKNHKRGNQLYLIRGAYSTPGYIMLCMFFATDNMVHLTPADAKKCYISNKWLPSGIQDLFGKANIYIQPIK